MSTTYEAFGCTATVEPMTGYERAVYGCQGWYAIHFSYPAQPSQSFTHRGCTTMLEVLTTIHSLIGRNTPNSVRKLD